MARPRPVICPFRLSGRSFLARRKYAATTNLLPRNNAADDILLRSVFDVPQKSWAESVSRAFGSRTGLFQNEYLGSPEGFPAFANLSIDKARQMTKFLSEHHGNMTPSTVIKLFDRLSDTLCAVLDVSEFVRNAHPNPAFVVAAETAHESLLILMNELNTHPGLYEAIRTILESSAKLQSLSAEELTVAHVLFADFLRSGVNLDQTSRAKFVRLTAEISKAERNVFSDFVPKQDSISVPVSAAKGVWPGFNFQLDEATTEHVVIPTLGWKRDFAMARLEASNSLNMPKLLTRECADTRQLLWYESQTPRGDQLENLESMLRLRGSLARLVGRRSYAESILTKSMAKSPGILRILELLAKVERSSNDFSDQSHQDCNPACSSRTIWAGKPQETSSSLAGASVNAFLGYRLLSKFALSQPRKKVIYF